MNCKPGDLAITVALNDHPTSLANSGRIVEVVRYVGLYRYAGGSVGMNTWLVKLLGSTMRAKNRVYRGEAYIDDANLRPIRGDGISDEEVRDLYTPKPAETAATRKPVHGGYPA